MINYLVFNKEIYTLVAGMEFAKWVEEFLLEQKDKNRFSIFAIIDENELHNRMSTETPYHIDDTKD